MAYINKITIVGNLTKDPEVRKTSTGTSVCYFGIESSRQFKNRQSGAMDKETCFIDVNIWGAQAEASTQSLKKGLTVLVEGHIKFNTWLDQTGVKHAKHLIVAEQVIPFYASPDQIMNSGNSSQANPVVTTMLGSNPVNTATNNNSTQDHNNLPF